MTPDMRKFAAALLLSGFCVFRLAASPQEQSAPQAGTIHVSVDRVNVGVIVTDVRGRFVEGLQREDFHLFDNAAEQPISAFASMEESGQVLLLLESGPAVYLLQGVHLRAAVALLDGLSPEDRVAVVSYAEAPAPILDFTADKRAAAAALDQIHFNLGFVQLNLSASLNTVLDWLARVPGKKTVVLLSTGVDTSSEETIANLLARLRSSDVRILAVALSGAFQAPKAAGKSKKPAPSPSADFAEADRLLTAVAAASGGRTYFPKNAQEFRSSYAEIAQLVRHEYSLAFVPPAHDAAVHALEVRVNPSVNAANAPPPAYRVDHRQAYLAPPPR